MGGRPGAGVGAQNHNLFLIHFKFQGLLISKKTDILKVKCHTGRGGKNQEKPLHTMARKKFSWELNLFWELSTIAYSF